MDPYAFDRSCGTLISYTDLSAQRRFKSNTPIDLSWFCPSPVLHPRLNLSPPSAVGLFVCAKAHLSGRGTTCHVYVLFLCSCFPEFPGLSVSMVFD